MAKISRGRFLQSAGLSAAAALAAPAIAGAQLSGSRLNDIDHFIILMQENRSFDHYFGSLAGVRGFDDPHPLRLANGRSVFYQPDAVNPDGYVLPFRLDTATTSAQQLARSQPRVGRAARLARRRKDGRLGCGASRLTNGAAGPLTMGYYTREDSAVLLRARRRVHDLRRLPLLGARADLSEPAVLHDRLDRSERHARRPGAQQRRVRRQDPYTWETYPERLERAGISWQIYYDVFDDYLMNILTYFQPYQDAAALRRRSIKQARHGPSVRNIS